MGGLLILVVVWALFLFGTVKSWRDHPSLRIILLIITVILALAVIFVAGAVLFGGGAIPPRSGFPPPGG